VNENRKRKKKTHEGKSGGDETGDGTTGEERGSVQKKEQPRKLKTRHT